MKNMDPLNDNVVALLQASSDAFTRELWKDGKNTNRLFFFSCQIQAASSKYEESAAENQPLLPTDHVVIETIHPPPSFTLSLVAFLLF